MNKDKLEIIGLAGTNGSGKDTVGHILSKQYGYLFVSVSDLLREEARKRGLPVSREVLRTISAEWRRAFGLGVLVDRATQEFEEQRGKYSGVVISPMRNVGETEHLQQLDGTMIWVDADPRIRYERVQANAAARARAAEDNKTFEQFLAEEQVEMNQSGDAATLNMSAVKARCDVFLDNNSSNIEDLQTAVTRQLGLN